MGCDSTAGKERVRLLHLLRLGHVDARVRDVATLFEGNVFRQPSRVLVEHNVLAVLDELRCQLAQMLEFRPAQLTQHSRNDRQNEANMLSSVHI